ncbi:MAG: hypothetical protein L0177_19340, partial [Chloroflexi bacterium]|nr:hypothetical protein [Chloroflexota bacterium]
MTSLQFLRSQWRAVLPGLLSLVVLATLVLVVPSRLQSSNSTAPAAALPSSASSLPSSSSPLGAATSSAVPTLPSSAGQPGVIGPTGGSGRRTFPGVTDKEILAGFTYQIEACGGFDTTAMGNALGINTDQTALYKDAVKLFNEYPAVALELTREQAKVLGPRGYYGRKVTPRIYDSRGPSCQDAGRAMAIKAVEQDRIFAMVQEGQEGNSSWISEEVASRRRIHIGSATSTKSYWDKRAPYAWDGRWGQGDSAMVATASWACRDLAGRAVSSPRDALINGKTRKFGLIRFDTPPDAEVARAVDTELSRCGASLVDDIAVSTDLGTAQQQGPQALARMHQDGITSIFMGVDWQNQTTLTQTATKQGYFPEWLISTHMQADWPARIYYFWDQAQRNLVMGTTHIYSHHQLKHTETYEWKMWRFLHRDGSNPPVGWREKLYQARVLYRGIYGAGPDLTPDTWVKGLSLFCNPCARTDPLQPLELQRVGQFSNLADFG